MITKVRIAQLAIVALVLLVVMVPTLFKIGIFLLGAIVVVATLAFAWDLLGPSDPGID